MRKVMRSLALAFVVFAWLPYSSLAGIHYVWTNSPANGPGTSWATAFHDIQSAIDVAGIGDTVLVTNGVYATGGRITPSGSLMCRTVATNAIILKSVNGPANTLIVGQGPLGDSAVRCAYLENGAILSGFTLMNGSTRVVLAGNMDGNGGGVYAGIGCAISNCVIAGNAAFFQGGGVYGGTVENCTMTSNSAFFGGGVCDSSISRCTITTNSARCGGGAYGGLVDTSLIRDNSAADYGGGTFWGAVNNCTIGYNSSANGGGTYCSAVTNSIVLYNSAANGANFVGGGYGYSCTTPDPGGIGNIVSSTPLFVDDSDCHLRGGSLCIDAGNNAYLSAGSDLDGFSRPLIGNPDGLAIVDMGCYEYVNPRPGPALIWYAWMNSPVNGPGTNWATAFHDIQSAIDAAEIGDTVLVTNGVYTTGSRIVPGGSLACRIVATSAIKVRSVNGPANTFIVGQGPIGNSAVRCAYLANGTLFSGFTLSNGFTRAMTAGHPPLDERGGGVYAGDGVVLSNCVITHCSAAWYGGGMYGGELVDSIITGCSAYCGGGAEGITANNCTISGNSATGPDGGGVFYGTLNRCVVSSNSAGQHGGGTYMVTANNCTIVSNSATYGGGADYGTLNNCLIVSNLAQHGSGGGVYGGGNNPVFPDGNTTLRNCTIVGNSAVENLAGQQGNGGGLCLLEGGSIANSIVYNNSAPTGPNVYFWWFNGPPPTMSYSCTTPNPGGLGNITAAPLFVGGDNYRLQAGSPCIDAGNNALMPAGDDLDGVARPLDGNDDDVSTVDMGCYEYVNALADSDGDVMPDVWETANGLDQHNPNDASLDADHDGMSNLAEYIAGTVPTDGNSVLAITALTPSASGLTLRWPSVAERYYTIGSGPDLRLPLTNPAASHLQATPPTNPALVNPGEASMMFYRVIVE